jgi:hypothetical protein
MHVGPWVLVSLMVAVIVLVVLAVGDAAAPSSCADAEDSVDGKLFTQAERRYREILAEEPENDCAQEGMDRVAAGLCKRANELMRFRASSPAKTMYRQVLSFEPPPLNQTIKCAVDGLGNFGSDDPQPVAGAP